VRHGNKSNLLGMDQSEVKMFLGDKNQRSLKTGLSLYPLWIQGIGTWGYGFMLYLATMTGYMPWHAFRLFVYRCLGVKIGQHTAFGWRARFFYPSGIKIGDHCVIGNDGFFDGRQGITIGNDVVLSMGVWIWTWQHDPQSPTFESTGGPVVIDDYAWVSSRVTVLPNVCIGKGAVVAANALVTKDVAPYTIVGGVPARAIGERTRELAYHLDYRLSFQ
jgi:acetyltransferase-like isoleucine patch superfamily enzyme